MYSKLMKFKIYGSRNNLQLNIMDDFIVLDNSLKLTYSQNKHKDYIKYKYISR